MLSTTYDMIRMRFPRVDAIENIKFMITSWRFLCTELFSFTENFCKLLCEKEVTMCSTTCLKFAGSLRFSGPLHRRGLTSIDTSYFALEQYWFHFIAGEKIHLLFCFKRVCFSFMYAVWELLTGRNIWYWRINLKEAWLLRPVRFVKVTC